MPLDAAGIASFIVPQNDDGVLTLPLGQSSILAQYAGDATHAPSSSVYTINVYNQFSTPDFAMQSNTTYQTISAGNRAARFTLQFTSMNNLAALGIPITLSYTTPPGVTCTGGPASPNFRQTIYATVNVTCRPCGGNDNPASGGGDESTREFTRLLAGRGRSSTGVHSALRCTEAAAQVANADGLAGAVYGGLWLHRLWSIGGERSEQDYYDSLFGSSDAKTNASTGSWQLYGDRDGQCSGLQQLAAEHDGERRAQHTAQGCGAVDREASDTRRGKLRLVPLRFLYGNVDRSFARILKAQGKRSARITAGPRCMI